MISLPNTMLQIPRSSAKSQSGSPTGELDDCDHQPTLAAQGAPTLMKRVWAGGRWQAALHLLGHQLEKADAISVSSVAALQEARWLTTHDATPRIYGSMATNL